MDMKSEGQGEVQGDCVVVFGNMVINTQKEGSELRSYSLKGMGDSEVCWVSWTSKWKCTVYMVKY